MWSVSESPTCKPGIGGTVVTTTTSIYDKIGGKPALNAVVDEFYKRVLADESLAPVFDGVDMQAQRNHQVAFLAFALGGPAEYQGAGMKAAHDGRGITDGHFGAVAGHLQGTLQWAGVGASEVEQIMAAAASLQPDIVAS